MPVPEHRHDAGTGSWEDDLVAERDRWMNQALEAEAEVERLREQLDGVGEVHMRQIGEIRELWEGEVERLRAALVQASQDIREVYRAGFDSERQRIAGAARARIAGTLDGGGS